ncbi:MAG: hypothetical protein Q8M08_08040 [Bacteroidales bacterium]|nr:hypothetical protein [Bacteroidales bacterium]
MNPDLFEFIGNVRQRRTRKFRNQFYVFLVCLLLSIFIWTLVRLSKEYYYSIEYHLTYTQVPANLRMVATSDSTINLRIRLQGFDFFSEQFISRQHREYEVSLRNIRLQNPGGRTLGYLLTNRIGKEIISQTNFPSEVYLVSPDTLFFEFEKLTGRKPTQNLKLETIPKMTVQKDTLINHPNSAVKQSFIKKNHSKNK